MLCLAIFLLSIVQVFCTDSSPSFKIDVDNRQFLLDGDPFQYIAGEIHYFRIPHGKWDDRLKRVRAMGLNAITVPVPWNFHQYIENDPPFFSEDFNVPKFIETAHANGLYTILRIGPYIGAEWDNGGLPWWLIRLKGLNKFRSSDAVFMAQVTQWFNHLLPKLYKLVRKNAGPILMVQIEHLYGTLGICDQQYLQALANLVKHNLGDDTVIFTVDPPEQDYLKCGTVPGVFSTIEVTPVNNQSQIESWFNLQQTFSKGPNVASNLVISSSKLWGQNISSQYTDDIILNSAKTAYSLNASFSFSLAHGGTNYGYWNGAIKNYPYTTSYDSFAPISESGDVTVLFLKIRAWINSFPGWQYPPATIPINLPRTAYPDAPLVIFDTVSGFIIGNNPLCWVTAETPRTAEYIRHGYGYMYYNTTITDCGPLYFPKYADNAYIYLNRNFVGALYQQFSNIHNNTMHLEGCLNGNNYLEIIIEITGRTSTGYPDMSRGLQDNVYLNNITIQNWLSCEVPIVSYDEVTLHSNKTEDQLKYRRNVETTNRLTVWQPAVYLAYFHIKTAPTDTFLDVRGWGKGVVSINQYNIGRYWSTVGPQQTLFIPSEFLKKGSNLVMFYEFEGATTACSAAGKCTAKFSASPIFDY